jgi:exodeoxyribonuclease VII large subunit
MSQLPLNLLPKRRIWTVSEITSRIRDILELEFDDAWLEGEVSNFKSSQPGHIYFTLKDAGAQIRCVCFRDAARRLKFRPEDGMSILVRGNISVYDVRGEYQLYVSHIEPAGQGALQLAFEQLKKRLAAEGLFDAARKKPIPLLPWRIGLVTSPSGAAVQDFLRILKRRFQNVSVLIYPARVQGEGSAAEVVAGIEHFNAVRAVDVLIVARGGGSLEDLWTFNEESVARAIAASNIPVITGIGHETDFTMADFVADLRAPTPSAAGEIVVGQRVEFERHIAHERQRLMECMRYRVAVLHRRLQELRGHRGFRRPQDLLRKRGQQTDDLRAELVTALRQRVRLAHQRMTAAQGRLHAFSIRRRAEALALRVASLGQGIISALGRVAAGKRRALGNLQLRMASLDFQVRVSRLRRRLESSTNALHARAERGLGLRRRQLEALSIRLQERSPFGLLERGYAIAYDSAGAILRSPDQVSIGEKMSVRLAQGQVDASVLRKTKIAP